MRYWLRPIALCALILVIVWLGIVGVWLCIEWALSSTSVWLASAYGLGFVVVVAVCIVAILACIGGILASPAPPRKGGK